MLRLYNTLSRQLEDFEPAESGKVRMYVCGMTVYDYCHIGHARAMMTFDMVVRWLRASGYDVTYVRNHTDVDDKIIERAAELGEEPLALSQRFIEALDADLAAAGLIVPDAQPKVSDHITHIVEMTQQLIERGHAYAVDGDVYYAVESFPNYGALSGKRLDDLQAGTRVGVDDRKRHPGDFALWKSAKEGEISWASPWGQGRPGWHIECSAMSTALLGQTFDIHGGGIDLVFPHHENEIAQSEGATGCGPFAKYWLHNGHLTIVESGETAKMSKSLGNIIRIRDILQEVPAEVLRVLYLDGHYRSPMPYSHDRLEEALVALDRVYQAKELVEQFQQRPPGPGLDELANTVDGAKELQDKLQGFSTAFAEAMNDDFNSAKALSLLFDVARNLNRMAHGKAKVIKKCGAFAEPAMATFALVDDVLGIGGMASAAWFHEVRHKRLVAMGKSEADIDGRLADRTAARQAKDFAAADAIRDELVDLGVVIMDTPQGTDWRMSFA